MTLERTRDAGRPIRLGLPEKAAQFLLLVVVNAFVCDSREDRRGADPSVPNSQWRFLSGYQRQLWRDLPVAMQGYAVR